MFNFTNTKGRQDAPVQPQPQAAAMPQQADPAVEQRLTEIEAQRVAFSRKNPAFDMKQEMDNNPAFVNYVWWNNLTVEEAYFLTHREELLEEAHQEGIKSALSRKTRVVENGTSKSRPAIAKKNPKDLTDKEIDAIIQRAKNGETITF